MILGAFFFGGAEAFLIGVFFTATFFLRIGFGLGFSSSTGASASTAGASTVAASSVASVAG